jgi:dolichol-phosphate mannosyltransferase
VLELAVVIPTRNEVDTLEAVLEELHSLVILSGISTEVVVVDDGSTDGTLDLAKRLSVELPLLHLTLLEAAKPLSGFGSLIRFGTAYSTARYAVIVPADGTAPLELITEMVTRLRAGNQLVINSRYEAGSDDSRVGRRFRRYQKLYRRGIKLMLGQEINDSTNGFRAFDRRFALALGLSSKRFSICPELTFKTLLVGGKIEYVQGAPRELQSTGVEKFKLPHELPGYAHVLLRATLHRVGFRWF